MSRCYLAANGGSKEIKKRKKAGIFVKVPGPAMDAITFVGQTGSYRRRRFA